MYRRKLVRLRSAFTTTSTTSTTVPCRQLVTHNKGYTGESVIPAARSVMSTGAHRGCSGETHNIILYSNADYR